MHLLIGLGILLLSSIGHAEFWVLFVNRAYSFRIHHQKLRLLRRLHDIFVPLFPLFLLWKIGFGEKGLLVGGQLSEQSPITKWLLGLTALGVIPWLFGIVRWHWKLKHAFYYADSREDFDLLRLAASDPSIGDIQGPGKQFLRHFPQNEIYTIEVNVKRILLPCRTTVLNSDSPVERSPSEHSRKINNQPHKPHDKQHERQQEGRDPQTPSLRLIHFSDLHFIGCPGLGYYRWVMNQAISLQPDAFLFTGDLIDDPELMYPAAEILGTLTSHAPCYFVLGNHDWRYDHEELRRAVVKAGWIDVAGRSHSVTLAEHKVQIAGSELPWLGQRPPTAHENDTDLRLLLSHSPDQFRFAAAEGYDLMLAGHTHGGQVVLPLIGPVYSPSIHGVRFASGLFQLGSLHLHVSRGLGAKDPIRWRCKPELTCLDIVFQPESSTT